MSTNEDTKPEMPTIKKFWYHLGHGPWGRWSKIGSHKRKTDEKEYTSPRIVLPSEFEKYIGRTYIPFHAEMEVELYYKKESRECIVLVLDKG